MTSEQKPSSPSRVRERLIDTAYELFSKRGIRPVGIDELIRSSGVAKATFYRHFRSKNDLVLAFLARRSELWTTDWIVSESALRAETAEGRLLAIFDLFDEWFQQQDFEGCSFINVLLELRAEHPAGQASIAELGKIREIVRTRAVEAGLRDPESFARSWHILMKGSIVSAVEGDKQAAPRAKAMAKLLIAEHRLIDGEQPLSADANQSTA